MSEIPAVIPGITTDQVRLHQANLLVIESGLFLEGDRLEEKEELPEEEQIPPMADTEVKDYLYIVLQCIITIHIKYTFLHFAASLRVQARQIDQSPCQGEW